MSKLSETKQDQVMTKGLDFSKIKLKVQQQFNRMKDHELFRVSVDKDLLWNTYLNSFPAGTNPLYKEKAEHDCNCCRHFIKNAGTIVAIINGELQTIWDIEIDDEYQIVANSLSALIKNSVIENQFLHIEKSIGTDKSRQVLESMQTITWEHFHIDLPKNVVVKNEDLGTKLGELKSTRDVFERSLKEITIESIDIVLELIAQNSLYRGEEHKFVLNSFKTLKQEFDVLKTDNEKELFCWLKYKSVPQSVSKIKNTVIGSLLIDLSEGKDLEFAVKSFETKVAPVNYKRPTALVTKGMIEKAKEKIEELGFAPALQRRFAFIEDITINNIVFANREARKKIDNVFDELASTVSEKVKNFDKVEEVTIDKFLTEIVPTAHSLEIMFENKHMNNLVSLIAPVDPEAKNMFKWSNNFSWSYNGEFADSIKERVKQQGGTVEGDLRNSLSWFNTDDLDLHMKEPGGYEIYFRNKGQLSPNGGMLDVDMNASNLSRTPVENIVYKDKNRMKEGIYTLQVHNYTKRESTDVGFDVEIEFDGTVYTFSYDKAVKDSETITVAEIKYNKTEGFSIITSLPSSQTVKQAWNLPTQSFHKVNIVMYSPNYWDEKSVGNKHYFFMIENCLNDGSARGFFNEFLNEELNVHRKVLEMVGAKMKTEKSENQLSGLGFSSTQRNMLFCKVTGNFTRIVKILF